MTYEKIISRLRLMKNPRNIEGMQRFGIRGGEMRGISVYEIRRIAKEIGKDHDLAQRLWDSGIHEARMLACFVDDPDKVTEM
jgi:3-methyladenine DNA glycosylase AlkD